MLRPLLSSTLFPYTTLFRSFRGEGLGQADAVGRRRVELAGAGLLGVPLAGEEALLLEAPQQGVQRVRIGGEAVVLELLEQAVAVARCAQQLQAREHDGAAAQLLQVGVEGLAHAGHDTVWDTVVATKQ